MLNWTRDRNFKSMKHFASNNLVFYKAMESVDIHSRDLSTSSIVKSDSSLFSKKSN